MLTIEDLIALIEQQNDVIQSQNFRIEQLEDKMTEISSAFIAAKNTPSIANILPPKHDMTMLYTQLFHNENLNLNDKKGGKKEYSLKFEPFVNGKRQNGVDVGMMTPIEARDRLRKLNTPALTMRLIEAFCIDEVDGLIGVAKQKLPGKGRPFVPSQVAIMTGHHHMSTCEILLLIDDHQIDVRNFRPANGIQAKSAKWFTSTQV